MPAKIAKFQIRDAKTGDAIGPPLFGREFAVKRVAQLASKGIAAVIERLETTSL